MNVNETVLNILSNSTTSGAMLTLPGYLDRALYLQANTVLEAAGGKWNRKAKAHVFAGDAADAMDQIILTGSVTIPQDFGYFPTPPAVVARLLELAELRPRHRVLEPSAGQGAIAYEVVKRIGARVDCVELLDANIKALQALERDGNLNGTLHQADFLSIEPQPFYDRIVMNPPFAKQADVHHVLHALKFLKPIGLLVAVMAGGVTFRDNKLTVGFRDLVDERGGTIDPLPEGSFKASGTGVNTAIVTIPGA